MLAMLQVVVVALGSWGLGRTLIGPRLRRLHPALRFSMQSAVGLLAVSLVVFPERVQLIQIRVVIREYLATRPTWQRWTVYYAMTIAFLLLGSFNNSIQFIYFQF